MFVRVYFWMPKTLFGWCCAIIAVFAILFGLYYLLPGVDWGTGQTTSNEPSTAAVILLLAGVAGGTFIGAAVERPAKERISRHLALNARHGARFGANTRQVEALFDRLRTESLATWDALAAAHEGALATSWAGQRSEILQNIFRLGFERGEFSGRKAYLDRAGAEAVEVAVAASAGSPGDPPPSESVVQVRASAAVAMAVAVAARPYVKDSTLDLLWRPFQWLLPFAEAIQRSRR